MVEAGQDVWSPGPQGPAESGDLGDRAGRERADDLLGQPPARGRGVGLVDRAELLVGVPGDGRPRQVGSPATRPAFSLAICLSVRCSRPRRSRPRIL